MAIRLASLALAALIPCAACYAGQQTVQVHGAFSYSMNWGDEIEIAICPDKTSQLAIPQGMKLVRKLYRLNSMTGPECLYAKNEGVASSLLSKQLGVKEPTASYGDGSYHCDSYDGTGTFILASDFETIENGLDTTQAYATLKSVKDIRLESKTCGAGDSGGTKIKVSGGTSASPEDSSPTTISAEHDSVSTQLQAADAADHRRDYAKERKILEPLADQGNGIAIINLGVLMAKGQGYPKQDLVGAYYNYSFAMTSDDKHISETATQYRTNIMPEMSRAQIQEAQQAVIETMKRNGASAAQIRKVQAPRPSPTAL